MLSLDRTNRSLVLFAFLTALAVHTVASGQGAPAATAPAAAQWEQVWEHWYTLDLAESPAGWMRETLETDADGNFRSAAEMSFKISRGALELEVKMESEVLETRGGEPVRYRFLRDLALQSMDTVWEFGPESVTVTSMQGGRTVTKTAPRPGGQWLTPVAARQFWQARRDAGATEISYAVLEGEYGLDPVTMRYERVGEEVIEIGERSLPVTVWKSETTAMPGIVATSKFSEDGHLVYEEAPLPFGRMVTRATTKTAALAAGDAPAPELMLNTFVPVDRPIDRPREATASLLRVRVREGVMPELPSAGAQRVVPGDDPSSVLLKIDIEDNVPATAEELADPEYLEASATANHGDAMIEKLARSACRDVSADPGARANAMRRFVHDHISAKTLDTAFATASETARTRTGDCSEHGVLLCAMLRADGIPARVAMGLVYADQFAGRRDIFGWHMWTQALVDGKWIDLDATLDSRYDAAHVLTGTSSLSAGVGSSDMASVMMLIGNLEIDVVEVIHK